MQIVFSLYFSFKLIKKFSCSTFLENINITVKLKGRLVG